jgi:Rrf2 family transcriptional regulator, cysteine metabolism repressor
MAIGNARRAPIRVLSAHHQRPVRAKYSPKWACFRMTIVSVLWSSSPAGIAEKAKISAISASGAANGAAVRRALRIARNLAFAAVAAITLAAVLTITTKSPYAVRALTELARRGEGEPVPIGEIAKARDIPVQFLEGLFATLRRAGILQSQRGVKGGYLFARPPAEVTVLEVTELLDGELGSGPGSTDQVWTEATGALKTALRSTSIADLADRESDVGSPMYYI